MGNVHAFEPGKRGSSITSPSAFTRPAHPFTPAPTPFFQPFSLNGETHLEQAHRSGPLLDRIPIFPPGRDTPARSEEGQRTDHAGKQKLPVQGVPQALADLPTARSAQKTPRRGWNLADIPVSPDPTILPSTRKGASPPAFHPFAAPVVQRREKDETGEKKNDTGIPDRLKAHAEALSGLSMDDVQVHYNSAQPARLQALAYTYGTEIHLGPGQEQHLPHEIWHVVQQKQGRVGSASQLGDGPINDDQSLEREAEAMRTQVSASQPQGKSKALASSGATASNPPAIQCMKDPDGTIAQTIHDAYIAFHKRNKKFGLGGDVPSPSQMKPHIDAAVKAATDEGDAYDKFSTHVIDTHYPAKLYMKSDRVETYKTLENLYVKAKTNLESRKQHEAEQLAKAARLAAKKRPAEKQEGKATKKQRTFSDKEQEQLADLLKEKSTKQKLYHASELAYEKHKERAHAEIATRAEHNSLTKLGLPLSTSDMAMAQSKYTHATSGDALMLEKREAGKELDDTYQVSMMRGGGQSLQQVGPYLGENSVDQRITDMLQDKDIKMTSIDLARAVNVRDPEKLIEQLMEKQKKTKKSGTLSGTFVRDIRTLRNLRAIEMDRGPEIAFATNAEHRNAELGKIHYGQYARRTPLSASKATTELRKARGSRQNLKGQETPDYLAYIPDEIHRKSQDSITTFLTAVAEAPDEYSEGTAVVDALLKEKKSVEPSEELVDAIADVMRTPTRDK